MDPSTERYVTTIYSDPSTVPGLIPLLKGLTIRDFSSELPFLTKLTQYERKAPNFKKLLYTIHLLIFLIVMNSDPSFLNRQDGSKEVYIQSAKKVLNTVNLKINPLIIFIESSINDFESKGPRRPGGQLPDGWTAVPARCPNTGHNYTLYQHQDGRETQERPLLRDGAIDVAIERGTQRQQSVPKALRSPTEIKIDNFIDTFSRFGFQLGGNYNYNYISDPKTGKKFTINSKQGIKILNQFIKNIK
jgi:hypothetical protein